MHYKSPVALLGLLVLRIAVKFSNPKPPLPTGVSDFERRASHVVHTVLYALPAIMVIGWADVNLGGHTVRWAGIDMPQVFLALEEPIEETVTELTETLQMWLAYTMLGLVVVHVAAAFKHRWFDGHDVIYRMSFGRRWD